MQAINKVTLQSKFANSDIKFDSYEQYEQIQDLIDSCAVLNVIPVEWMENWANLQKDSLTCRNFIKRLVGDWEYINDKCQISEFDLKKLFQKKNTIE